jgi:DNA-binding MarR family transcriptional regulator
MERKMKMNYKRYRHSELQNAILQLLLSERCIEKRQLREKLVANPSTFTRAVKALVRKGLVKEMIINHKKIVCI